MKKYFRSKLNGRIFPYTERLVGNKNVELITEKEAFPQRDAPVDLAKREAKVDITVPEAVTEAPPPVAPELLAEASRPFGGRNASGRGKVTDKPMTVKEVVGLAGEI